MYCKEQYQILTGCVHQIPKSRTHNRTITFLQKRSKRIPTDISY